MGRWVDGRIDGWVGRCTGGMMGKQRSDYMYVRINSLMVGQLKHGDGNVYGWIDGRVGMGYRKRQKNEDEMMDR